MQSQHLLQQCTLLAKAKASLLTWCAINTQLNLCHAVHRRFQRVICMQNVASSPVTFPCHLTIDVSSAVQYAAVVVLLTSAFKGLHVYL